MQKSKLLYILQPIFGVLKTRGLPADKELKLNALSECDQNLFCSLFLFVPKFKFNCESGEVSGKQQTSIIIIEKTFCKLTATSV